MSKWIKWQLKFKQLVIIKHALADKIQKRKEQIEISRSCAEYSDRLEQLEKDLKEEENLYKEVADWIEELRTWFKK